jgi:hypothetical protein
MKKHIVITVLILLSIKAFSQENAVTISGGYASANIEDSNNKGTGWRINGLYEFIPSGGNVAHGFSFGYIGLTSEDGTGALKTTNKINSFPIYYAPRVMFGKDKVKLFIKGALGVQMAGLKREGAVELSDFDFGFYGGAGAGLMIFVKEDIFLNAEYEIAWASNNWYKDGWISTFNGGIGFKF